MALLARVIVLLHLPKTIGALVTFARAVVQGIGADHSTFPKPTPPLAQVTANIDALEAAEIATKTRARGTVQTRNQKRDLLVANLRDLHLYVQQLANARPDLAPAIVKSAGFAVRKPQTRIRPPLAVRPGAVSGTLYVKAHGSSRRAAHDWQYSLDQKSWVSLPSTLQARTDIENLAPASVVYVRHRTNTKDGTGDWSQIVTSVVQ